MVFLIDFFDPTYSLFKQVLPSILKHHGVYYSVNLCLRVVSGPASHMNVK